MAKGNSRRIEDILNNPADKAKLKSFIDEAVDSNIRLSAEKDHMKSIVAEAKEKIEIEPKLFRALVNLYAKNSFAEKQAEIEALDTAIEMLVMSVDNS